MTKDILARFVELTSCPMSKPQEKVALKQISEFLKLYSAEEVFMAIETICNRNHNIFSFNYIAKLLPDTVQRNNATREIPDVREAMSIIGLNSQKAVTYNDESRKRNTNKSKEFGVQRRLGEKFNFDLLKEHREDS